MCNCADRPKSIADPEYWSREVAFVGITASPSYFEQLDIGNFIPQLSYSQHLYRCGSCEQSWYIECAPEEEPSPLFCMKVERSSQQPSAEDIRAEKESLSVIAHGGFEAHRCQEMGCLNQRLKGRALCHLHITFP